MRERYVALHFSSYRPQGKVMFSEASVCSQEEGPSLERDPGQRQPGQRNRLERDPQDRDRPGKRTPMTSAAVDTHPTGMHSCFKSILSEFVAPWYSIAKETSCARL